MPQYKKVFDIGTYTGNGGQYRVGIPTLRPPGPTGTQVAGSTRFRASASAYLSRTPSVAGSNQKSTFSCWAKLPRPTDGTYNNMLYAVRMTGSQYWYVGFDGSSRFNVAEVVTSSQYSLLTTRIFKDSGVWTHFVASIDTTQATAANRVKLYVDGVLQTSFNTATYPTQNYTHTYMGTNSYIHAIGWGGGNGIYYGSEYYLSNVYYIDGQQLDASSFGELNSDGIWVPKAYSGTYGTNGFYLPMNSSSNYATDQSGNGNNFTPSGFNVTTANTTYDIMTDSPTDYLSGSMTTANNAGNYCTWNPIIGNSYLVNGTATVTNGALTVGDGATTYGLHGHGTIAVSSGKWYWEITCSSIGGSYGAIGIVNMNTLRTGGSTNNGYYYISMGGIYDTQPVQYSLTYSGAASYTTGDVIGVAMDLDAGTLTFYKNGVSQGALPVTITSGNYTPAVGDGQNATTYSFTLNAGQRPFSYTPPSGYKALNTYNITRPADSSLWFYGDTPDLMWIKNRSTTGLHTITDTVRGMGLNLVTSSTAAETSYPAVSEMNKFGMSVINDGTSIVNGSGNSMIYWAWKAGSNTSSTSVTNTNGSITSQVSANPSAGFSIVTYTGTAANATVGHGLGAVPSFYIIHPRNDGTLRNWNVYHSSIGNTGSVYLNSTSGVATATVWNNTSPTSSVFSLGATPVGQEVNSSGLNYVAYCWTAIPGYSAFGSYTGNGSADGPFVYLGFRPRWIMWKRTDTTSAWFMYDAVRSTYNVMGLEMYADTTSAEGATTRMDFLSNGFKLRAANAGDNASSGVYVYAAFAEIPFKFARAR